MVSVGTACPSTARFERVGGPIGSAADRCVYHLRDVVAVEGFLDYRRNNVDGIRIHTNPVQASALIYPLGTTSVALLMLGGGWYDTPVTGLDHFHDTQHRFGLHAGRGLQFVLSQHVPVEGSYRYLWIEKVDSRDRNIVDKQFQKSGHMVTGAYNVHC